MDESNSTLLSAEPVAEPQTVNGVLAQQARSRGTSELWTTTVGGGMNAVLLWTQFPSLHWLAGGFAAVAAYGIWGLLDRELSKLALKNDKATWTTVFVVFARTLVGIGGWSAALFAIVSFLSAALGGLSIPGR